MELGQPRYLVYEKFDAGGNILASPPIPGKFPNGRIIVGRDLQPAIKDFFQSQAAQTGSSGKLLELETNWLKVGHVDEIVSFLSNGKKVWLVMPDPMAGAAMLKGLPPECALFCPEKAEKSFGKASDFGPRFLELDPAIAAKPWAYARIISGRGTGQVAHIFKRAGRRMFIDKVWDLRGASPTTALSIARQGFCETMPIWIDVPENGSEVLLTTDSQMWLDQAGEEFPAVISAGELLRDDAFSASNRILRKRLEKIRKRCVGGLGLSNTDVIHLPVLMVGNREGKSAWWLSPNPVNMLQLDLKILMLSPFGPRDPQSGDLFESAYRKALQCVDREPVFIDGWNALHRLDGGARCGTNVLRNATTDLPSEN